MTEQELKLRSADPPAIETGPDYIANPLVRIRISNPLICDLLLEGRSVVVERPSVLGVLAGLNEPLSEERVIVRLQSAFDLSRPAAQKAFRQLVDAGLLVPPDYGAEMMNGIRHWEQRGWFDALLFHLRTHDLDYDDVAPQAAENATHQIMNAYIKEQLPPSFCKQASGSVRVELPAPSAWPEDQTVGDVLLRRRSGGRWTGSSLEPAVLSAVLHEGNSDNRRLRAEVARDCHDRPEALLRSAYCALETYVFVFDVEGYEPGFYLYDLMQHALTLLKPGLFREEMQKICIGQAKPAGASAVLVISAVWERYMYRYRHPRAYRNLLINISELAHRYVLTATAFKLSNFITPALDDEFACRTMMLTAFEEAPMYVVAIG